MKRIYLLWFLFIISISSKGQNSDTALISIENFRLQPGTFSWRNGDSFHDMTRWDSSPYQEGHLAQKSGSTWRFRMNYRLLPPNSYDRNYEEGYPLLIMFHGAGERGNCWDTNCYCTDCDPNSPEEGKANIAYLNNDHMLVHGGQPFMNAVNRAGSSKVGDPNLDPRAFPGFVLFPQMENNWGSATSASSSVANALRILRLVIKENNINPDRVYLAGLSMGGQAALKSLTMADWLFAAAICMSPVPFTSDFDYEGSVNIPLWIFQGGKDQYPKPSQTEKFINLFREAGGSVRYTFYEELGHNTWTTAFGDPEFFSWLLKEKKNQLFRYFDTDYLCATSDEGLKIGMPSGFPAYQWERNGVLLDGENGHSLIVKEEGEYRGRFSRVQGPGSGDWNEWSNMVKLDTYAPPAPDLQHEGTTFLPDLNNYNEAILFTR
jgi:predicted esterase